MNTSDAITYSSVQVIKLSHNRITVFLHDNTKILNMLETKD